MSYRQYSGLCPVGLGDADSQVVSQDVGSGLTVVGTAFHKVSGGTVIAAHAQHYRACLVLGTCDAVQHGPSN